MDDPVSLGSHSASMVNREGHLNQRHLVARDVCFVSMVNLALMTDLKRATQGLGRSAAQSFPPKRPRPWRDRM